MYKGETACKLLPAGSFDNIVKQLYLPNFIWIFAIYLDQLTKYLAVTFLKNADSYPIIKDVLHLTYLENRGAAFGSFKDHRWVFLVFSCVALVLFFAYLYFKTPKHALGRISLALLIGGGIGNMIDRILLGYVVDFVDFRLINFAIFNFADACVTVGTVLMFVYVLFFMEKEGRTDSHMTEKMTDGKENADCN